MTTRRVPGRPCGQVPGEPTGYVYPGLGELRAERIAHGQWRLIAMSGFTSWRPIVGDAGEVMIFDSLEAAVAEAKTFHDE